MLKKWITLPICNELIALELARKYMLSTDYPEVIKLKIVHPYSDNYQYQKEKTNLREKYAVVQKKITFDQLKPMPRKEQPQKIS